MNTIAVHPAAQSATLQIIIQAGERSTDVIMITRADQDLELPIVYVNAAFEQMTGYTAAEVLGLSPSLLQGPKTDPAAIQRIHDALHNWRPVREELLNYRKDGTPFTVELSMVPIADETGWFTHWFSIQRETTGQSALKDRIQQTELQLARILRAVPQLLWTADPGGECDWVSDSLAAFVGTDPSQCLGHGWLQFVHPSDREAAAGGVQTALASRHTSTSEMRLRRSDGVYSWFLQRAAPDLAADGSITGWVGSLTDISDRKQAEIALRASEQKLRAGLGVAKVALSEIDYDADIHHMSAEMATFFGFGDQPISLPQAIVHARIHPEDRARLAELDHAVLKHSDAPWFEIDMRIVLPHGELRWIRSRKLDTFENEGGNLRRRRATVASFDITAAKTAEVDLRETEQRLRLGIGVAKLGLLDIDYTAQTIRLSAEAARIYGLGNEDITLPREVVHGTLHPDDVSALRQLISTPPDPIGSNWLETEYRVIWPGGERRWIRARKSIQFDGVGPAFRPLRGIVAVFDITEEKVSQHRARENARRFRELAGGVAHDFNNLLTTIMLRASLVASQEGSAVHGHTQAILDVAHTAAGITRQLRTLSREHAPPTELADVNERVACLLDTSIAGLEPAIQVKFQRCDEPLAVLMDGPHFDQILLNLVTNAREAMPLGGTLTIATGLTRRVTSGEGHPPPVRYARLTISNTGPAISAETLSRMFEPYYTTKNDATGRGLGLAIVHKIVTDHRGEIVVRSDPGASTSFEVLLPLSELDPQVLPTPATAPVKPAAAALKTILVVEDDDSIRALLQDALTDKGFHVLACADGRYGLELADECTHPIDLLITDIRMPRVDGITLARALTAARPKMKVLLISGNGTPAEQQEGWPLLSKPFTSDELSRSVTQAIAH